MNRKITFLIGSWVLLASLTQIGCQSLSKPKFPWSKTPESELSPDAPENFGEVAKMDIVWKDDVLPDAQGRLQRGIGGRIHLLDKDGNPVRAHGSLTVYGFDEHNGGVSSPRPDKRFHFSDSELQAVYSKSNIGHSYSVWLPWDEKGFQKTIAVLPIFRGEDGRLTKGDHARAVLLGPEAPSHAISTVEQRQRRTEEQGLVERVVYQSGVSAAEHAAHLESSRIGTQATTIRVPESAAAIRETFKQSNMPATPSASTPGTLPAGVPRYTGSGEGLLPHSNSGLGRTSEQSNHNGSTTGSTSEWSLPVETATAPSGSHWDRAVEQFMKNGPRKNVGLPGAR